MPIRTVHLHHMMTGSSVGYILWVGGRSVDWPRRVETNKEAKKDTVPRPERDP